MQDRSPIIDPVSFRSNACPEMDREKNWIAGERICDEREKGGPLVQKGRYMHSNPAATRSLCCRSRVEWLLPLHSASLYTSIFSPLSPLLYLAALQIHCQGQVRRPPREQRKNCFPLRRGTKRARAPAAGKDSFEHSHGQLHTYAMHLDLAHPGSVFIRAQYNLRADDSR